MWQDYILDLIFPKFCFGCKKEDDYLCEDCKATLEISGFHEKYQTKYLSDLYFALRYDKPLIKKLIKSFRNEPFIKELAKPLASLILNHFQLLDNEPDLSDFSLIPMPITKKELKWRGYNPAEEITKELSWFLKIPLISDCLAKEKKIISIKNKELLKGKSVVLVDDIYTDGSAMEECSLALKDSGAKGVWGVVVARGK
ncbi:MAG: hypothetical protein WC514_02585 [Candidatus Paceibacterota bacterium]